MTNDSKAIACACVAVLSWSTVATAFKYQEYEWKAHLPQMGLKSGRTLLDDYTFLDGSPIGRKVEERPF